MEHKSYWLDSINAPDLPCFEGEKKCDIAIVGAGITGITTAALLAQSGAKVTVLEANRLGSGTTGNTTAKITIQHGLKYQNLSEHKAACYFRANHMGLQQIESFITNNNISCDFSKVPSYVYTQDNSRVEDIENEAAIYDALGIDGGMISETKLPFDITSALRIENQAQFHPIKYLYALAKIITDNGGQIFEHSMVRDVEKGIQCVLATDNGKLIANNIVLATNYPLIEFPGLFFLKLHQERSYIISTNAKKLDVKGMYINVERPVNSIRMHYGSKENLLLLGGYGHKTGLELDEKNAYTSLIHFLGTGFSAATQTPSYEWSAQDCQTLDEIPFVGAISKNHDNIYIATGYAKWGMTNATAAAIMIADSLMDSENIDRDASSIFSPSRFTPAASSKNFLKQTATTIKKFTAGNLTIPPGSFDDIEYGKGAVLRINSKACAVHKDKNGEISVYTAHCTHLKCPLEYNEVENTFDCGCHGSRFAMDGSVIDGPAKLPLEKIEVS